MVGLMLGRLVLEVLSELGGDESIGGDLQGHLRFIIFDVLAHILPAIQ